MAKQLPSWSTLGSFITSLSPFVTSLISFFATSMFISFRSSLSLPTSVLTWRTNIRWWGHRVRITVRFRWFHIRIRWILWIRQMVSLPPLLSVSRRFLVLFCFQFIYFLFVCRKKKKRYLKWNLWKNSGNSSNKKGWHRMRGKQERKHSSYTCWISKPRKSNRPTNSHTYCHTYINSRILTLNEFTTIDYFHCYSGSPFFITHIFNILQYFISLHKLPKDHILPVIQNPQQAL